MSHSSSPKPSRQRTSLWRRHASKLSAGFVFLLLAAVFQQYSASNKRSSTAAAAQLDRLPDAYYYAPPAQPQQRRWLQEIIKDGDGPAINDDITRDETCKEYMSKFLNGTTDFKDTCQGMYNAYQAADCADETHTVIAAQKKHKHKHGNDTDDDVLIDDFYENWECCSSIFEYYNTHCHEPVLDSERLLGIVGVLVICSMAKAFVHHFMSLQWVPDAVIYVLVGAFTGGVCRLIAPHIVARRLSFNNDLFLHILLPPIVFQAALKINKRSFRRDLFPIFSFAILGTFFSAIAVGFITYYLTKWGSGTSLPFLDSLMFGSLISSIDPVATLGILSGVGVSERDTIYTLVFGESLLNDGVAIVLFDTLAKHLGDKAVVDHATAWEILGKFCAISFGSIVVGLLCGCCCTLYFYNLWGKHQPVTEVAIFFSWALIPFYLSDMFGFSGIISIMVMGFVLDYFVVGGNQSDEGDWMDFMRFRCAGSTVQSTGGLPTGGTGIEPSPVVIPTRYQRLQMALCKAFSGRGHILSKSRHHVGFVAEVISDVMETAIFAYLGLFLFNDNSQWDLKLNGVAIFGCITSRLAMVIMMSMLINLSVYFELETLLCQFCCRMWSNLHNSNNRNNVTGASRSMSAPLLERERSYDEPRTAEDDDGDDGSGTSNAKRFLDWETQLILLLAGVRGAVSFALVANLPVYDAVTKHGSQYKAELKAMTSSSIFFTLFVFGGLTFFVVTREQSNTSRERVAGRFTHRLSSMPLASDNEEEESDAVGPSGFTLEMEHSPQSSAHPNGSSFRR